MKTSFHVTIRITSLTGSADRLPPPWQRPAQLEGVFILAPLQFRVNICKKPEDFESPGPFYTFFT